MTTEILQTYARRLRDLLRANPLTPETGLAPAFQQLLTDLLPTLPAVQALIVSPEYNNPGVGRPDIALIVQGQPARAFVELKAPAKPADPERWRDAHDKRQYERLKELGAWSTSNFVDFHLFARGDELGRATIAPVRALNPDTPDATADRLIEGHDAQPFLTLLATLARADAPVARNAQQLAELMAHSARLVRSALQERIGELHASGNAQHPLMMVRETFRNVLYAHPEAGGYTNADFDELFSSAFAQTLAFGLLLVREASGAPVDAEAWRHMPDEHPLMRATLRVLSEHEVTREIGIGFDVMCDTVNSFAPEILAVQPDGRDPILYFYENFLQIFDPAARERYGVYYTPIEVVRYMVGSLDRALRENLDTDGLRDPDVTILDPATGTGTFLLGIAERVRDQVTADEGGPAASMALRNLATRMFAFELLVGPYAVAHYRLHHALRNRPADEGEDGEQPVNLPRLGIYLADTLSNPDADAPLGALGIQGIPIDEERREANRIKGRQPILAIIGNPPYKRLEEGENETLVGRWMDGVWDDLKAPVRDAGQGGQLNTFPEFSVAFWRWAMWKLFEAEGAPQRGVIAFITNRKFLTGWPYAGLRKMMRERFDRIEIVDLRGDVRVGPRGDVADDVGVFNIQVGTAITIAIADGTKEEGALAEITYTDSWASDLFARRAKLDWLSDAAGTGTMEDSVPVQRQVLDDMRPTPFANGEWLSIREAFRESSNGTQTKRDSFVYDAGESRLRDRLQTFVAGPHDEAQRVAIDQTARDLFHPTGARPFDVARDRIRARLLENDASLLVRASYRPLDVRWMCDDLSAIDRPRPTLRAMWGAGNATLYTMPSGVGAGPSLWCHGLLPDYHSFRGSYGGYAFSLYDRRHGPEATNLSPVLLAHLAEAYGQHVAPEDAFDAILALLSATSYTRRFAEDLEDVFPHIPFPANHAVLMRAVTAGREIRAVETFARAPEARFRPAAFFRLATETAAEDVVGAVTMRDGEIVLCPDGRGRIIGIPEAVWSFAVSGYRVLPRWIEGRRGLPADIALIRELRDVAARIAELIHRFDEADLVLNDTLEDTLTREELGFPAPVEEGEAAGDD
ncbi:MAG: type ISP restriction/modification enzyme [Pseudomonadota bacterium]